jgi:HEAT repeat protein
MPGLLRSPKLWSSSVVVLTITLVSLCAYGYHRHSRIVGLIEEIKSGEPEVAQEATKSLGQMGPDVVDYLLPTIKEMSSQSRAYTAEVLSNVSASAIPSLVAALKNKEGAVRAASAEILGKMGSAAKDAVPDLIEALNDEDQSVGEKVKAALGEIKDPRAIEPLIATFKRNERPTAGDAAEESLVKIGPDAIPALILALQDDASRVRESSARVLGRMSPAAKDAVPGLIKALDDKDEGVRHEAQVALGEIKDPRAIEPLFSPCYRTESLDQTARAALGKIGLEAIPFLTEKLKDPRPNLRQCAASALGEIGPTARGSAAVPSLIALLNDPKVRDDEKFLGLRDQAIWALGKIKDEEAIPTLMEMLKKKAPANSVIVALGNIGPPAKEAVPLLMSMIWEYGLHTDAVAALKKIIPESINDIIYQEQEYARLGEAISSVELLPPMKEEYSTGDNQTPVDVFVTFKWQLKDRKPGVLFCSTVYTDKGYNPFDGDYEKSFPAAQATMLRQRLNYSRYYNTPFEWGVIVKACRDTETSCNKSGSCVGRAFKSPVDKYDMQD